MARPKAGSGQIGAVDGRRNAGRQLGVATRTRPGLFDDGPGGRIRDQCGKHRVVELVAAAYRAVSAQDGRARECEIADRVEHLVTDELVRKAQAALVEDTILADDQRVLER